MPARAAHGPQELHPRLLGRAVALAAIARHAGAHDVLPGRRPAERHGRDVIEVELPNRLAEAAVLAAEAVALEHVATREAHLVAWKAGERAEHDDARHSEHAALREPHDGPIVGRPRASPLREAERRVVAEDDARLALVE